MKDVLIGPFLLGANNMAPPDALPKDDKGRQIAAAEIINADIDATGNIKRRAGFAVVQAFSGAHSGFSDGVRTLLVRGGSLYRVTDFSPYSETLVKVLSNDSPMSYAPFNGEVYCSNGTDFGRISAANVWSERGLPVPPSISLSSAAGALPAGKYQVAITYATGSTEEGGAIHANIDVAINSNITVTLPAGSGGATHINVYLSELNGSTVYFHSQLAVGTASVVLSSLATGRKLLTPFLEPLPAGTILSVYNGHLISASGGRAYISEPFNLGQYDPAKGYIDFPSMLRVIAPCENGVYFVTDKDTKWFQGTNPHAFEHVADTLPYGGAAGTAFEHKGADVVGWYGAEGVVLAGADGQVKAIQHDLYATDRAINGAVSVFANDGVWYATACLFSTTANPRGNVASSGTTTYTVNMASGATTTYSGFSFNSIMLAEDGNRYGLNGSGIFLIGGATDAGSSIAASIDMGQIKTGASQSRVPHAYSGVVSGTYMKLVVTDRASSYEYLSRSFDAADLYVHRFDLGLGIREDWLGMKIQNVSGADFSLATFSVLSAGSSRRI